MFQTYKDVVTVKEMCRMLGIGLNTAYALLQTGKIKSVKIGRQYRIPKRNIIDFLKRF